MGGASGGSTDATSGSDDAAGSLLTLVQAVVDEVHRGRGPNATWDARLDADLGLDSLSVVELVARCEDRFGITVADDLLASVATPRDLLDAVDGDGPARRPHQAAVAPEPAPGGEPAPPGGGEGEPTRTAPRAYGVWALAVFGVVSLVVWLVVLVLPGLTRRWRVVRGAARLVVALVGSRLTVDGGDHLPGDGPFVLVANHASHIDPLVTALLLERPPVFTVIAGVADRWVVRRFLRRMQVRLVQRGDRVDGRQVTRELVDVLRSGRPVVFFPEGHRTPRFGVDQFRMGAFVVAAEAGFPVVPVAIRGPRDILPVGSVWPRRAALHATITRPLTADRSDWTGALDLRDRARVAILDACDEPDLLA